MLKNISQPLDNQNSNPIGSTNSECRGIDSHKKILCTSKLIDNKCKYDKKCIYAHSLNEQKIDSERKYLYEIVLDKNLKKFNLSEGNLTDDFYKNLIFLTTYCENCKMNKCLGGLNCRYGVCNSYLKICKNDLLTGDCINAIREIKIPENYLIKALNYVRAPIYMGCINGHHLTPRGLPCYKNLISNKQPNAETLVFLNRFNNNNRKYFLTDEECKELLGEFNEINEIDSETDSDSD